MIDGRQSWTPKREQVGCRVTPARISSITSTKERIIENGWDPPLYISSSFDQSDLNGVMSCISIPCNIIAIINATIGSAISR